LTTGKSKSTLQDQPEIKLAWTVAAYYLIAGTVFILTTDLLQYFLYPNGSPADITLWQTVAAQVFVVVTTGALYFFIRNYLKSLLVYQQRLFQNENRLMVILDSLPNVFVIYNEDLRFEFVNSLGVTLSGTTKDKLLGRRDEDVFPKESTCDYVKLLRRAKDTKTVQKGECKVLLPNGQTVFAVVQYVPLLDDQNNITQIIGITHNVTEQKAIETALRRSEQQFRLLADNLPGIVYICRNDDVYSTLYVNQYIERIVGISPREFLSGETQMKDIIYPLDWDEVVASTNKALAERRPYHMVYRMVHKSGDLRWVEEEGQGIYKDGELEFIQGFIKDVTEQRHVQRKQRILTELGQQLAAVNTLEKLGRVVINTVSDIWEWDALMLSVHQSGDSQVRIIVEADTFNGEKRFEHNARVTIPERIRRKRPELVLRQPGEVVDKPGRFGDLSRPSQSLMYCPIQVGERKGGLISVQSYQVNFFNEEDLEILQSIAETVAPAAERCRTEERSRAFAILGEQLNAATTPEEAAEIIVTVADDLIGWEACIISDYSAKENLLHNLVGYDVINGTRTSLAMDDEPFIPAGLSKKALEHGELLILRNKDYESPVGARTFGDNSRHSQSMIFAAMHGITGLTGLISLHSYTRDAYDQEDVQTLKALANHCSNALDRTRAQQALALREKNYRNAITFAGAVPYQLDYTTKTYVFVGEGIETITGWPASDFTVSLWNSIIQEVVEAGTSEKIDKTDTNAIKRIRKKGTWRADIRILTRSGESRWVADTSVDIPDEDGYFRGSLGILQDISERKENENRLLYDSLHDPLTGLANRSLLLDHLQLAIHRAHRRSTYCFAVLFLDIDRFKTINDSLGHIAGDKLLETVAQRLQTCVRPDDTVARFAGDEFVILLDDVCNSSDVVPVADRILKDISQPVMLEGQEVFASASMGIAISSPDYVNPEDLLRDADNALYQAKSLGKSRYEIFDASMYDRAVKTLALETDLRRGLERNEFVLHYQPIVSLPSGAIVKFEALVRWNHPVRGLVSPAEFIPLAEEMGMIIPLGFWVMDEAAQQLKKWHEQFPQDPPLVMSINLSVRQFSVPDLDSQLHSIVRSKGIDPKYIKLEITETVFLERKESVINLLNRLQALGFGLSLDDFGTGYSSLSNLHLFPIEWIKIDRSFTCRIAQPGPEREIVRSIVQLATNLGMGVTAEGVETESQLKMLSEMNCCHVQGYYLSRPLKPDDATALLASRPDYSFEL